MKRHMARNDMNINEFERHLSNETKAWIESDVAAKVMYDRIIDATNQAKEFYDAAERNEVTRWVPENGGGDCYISPLADADAEAALVLRLALSGYALMIGKRDVSHNIDRAGQVACLINEPDEPAKKTEKSPARGKKVCKTNIVKCLRKSWDTAEIIPINEHWSCGITVNDDDVIEFDAVLTCDGNVVSRVVAWGNKGTAKKDVFEYCVEKMMSDYDDRIKYEGINLDALDKRTIVANIGKAYDYFYDNYDEVAEYDSSLKFGEWLLNNRIEFVRELVDIRRDVFSSDREVAALGYSVNELAA